MTPNKLPPLPEPDAWLRIFEDDGEPMEEFCSSATRPANWPIGDCVAIYYGCTVREHTAEALRQSQSLPAGAVDLTSSALYHAANRLLARIGSEGEIDSKASEVVELMDILTAVDGGQYQALQADAREKGEACKVCNGKGFIRSHGMPWPDDEVPCPHDATQPAQASEAESIGRSPVLYGRDGGADWYIEDGTETICVDIDFDPARQLSILLKQDGSVSWAIYVQHPDSSNVKASGPSVMNHGFFAALGHITGATSSQETASE